MENQLDAQIRAICGAPAPATGPTPGPVNASLKYPVCAACGHVAVWNADTEPAPKCKCGAAYKMIAPTMEIAKRTSAQFMSAQSTPAPVAPATAPAASAPVSEPEAPQPQPDPTPAPPTPKRTRRPMAPKPAPDQTSASSNPVNTALGATSAPPTTGLNVPLTGKEARENAERALCVKLNAMAVVEVGTGTVDALGYTKWIEKDGHRLPTWNFKELTDTPESFKAELNAARRTDGNITIDVARVCGLEPIELRQARFQNLLVANLVGGNPSGRVSCMPGSKVRIGAKLSHAGRPVFFIMGPV